MPARGSKEKVQSGADKRQTAYESEHRPRINESARSLIGWDKKIIDLYAGGYSFLGWMFSEPGWLYRGASSGLRELILTGRFGHFQGSKSVTHLEQELDIYFCSQDLSDSCTVARFWEGKQDQFIAVFKSSLFNRKLDEKRAAVLGFAEPGIVFKYPFMTEPLSVSDMDWLLVPPGDKQQLDSIVRESASPSLNSELRNSLLKWSKNGTMEKLITFDMDSSILLDRNRCEKAIVDLLHQVGVRSALAEATPNLPKASL